MFARARLARVRGALCASAMAATVHLLGDLANEESARKMYQNDEEATKKFFRQLVRKLIGNSSWQFNSAHWEAEDVNAFYQGASAYTRFCTTMMQRKPELCLYDTDASGEQLLNYHDLAKGLTKTSARKYALLMPGLVSKHGNKRVSATTVRAFLTETPEGLEDLRKANLIAVPNNKRDMKTVNDKLVPTYRYFILDRDQLRRFRWSRWHHRRSVVQYDERNALTIDCYDLEVWTLRLFNHEVEHLDPAHNYGERDELHECDVLVNMKLDLGVFNHDPLYMDSYNVIKAGGLGPYHFLVRAYQLSQKGPPDAPFQFARLVGDYVRSDIPDSLNTATSIANACFKVYRDGKWVVRKCKKIRERLKDCLDGLRILDTGDSKGAVQTRLRFKQQAAASIGATIDKAPQQRMAAPVDASAQALQQTAEAVLLEDNDEPAIVEVDEGASPTEVPDAAENLQVQKEADAKASQPSKLTGLKAMFKAQEERAAASSKRAKIDQGETSATASPEEEVAEGSESDWEMLPDDGARTPPGSPPPEEDKRSDIAGAGFRPPPPTSAPSAAATTTQ